MSGDDKLQATIRRGLAGAVAALAVAADEVRGAEGASVPLEPSPESPPMVAVAPRGRTATFSFSDEQLLLGDQREGGLLYVGPRAGHGAPVLVMLHGINPKSVLHPWFGGGGADLRTLLDGMIERREVEPLVVVAPSQTRNASSGSMLWPDLDVDVLLDAAEPSLPAGVTIDRRRVVLAGHSGAGCNQRGGLLHRTWDTSGTANAAKPLGVVALDTCLGPAVAQGLVATAGGAPLYVYWQPHVWPRDVRGAQEVFTSHVTTTPGATVEFERLDDLSSEPHDAIVGLGLQRALPQLLPPSSDE